MVIETDMSPIELLTWQLQRIVFEVDLRRGDVIAWPDDEEDRESLEKIEKALAEYKVVFEQLGQMEIYNKETMFL